MIDRHRWLTRTARLRRSLPLMLMLMLVTAGVFGMHTLGHASSDHGTGHGTHAPVAAGSVADVSVADMDACCADITAGHIAAVNTEGANIASGGQPQPSGLDPMTVCLAILYAAGLTIALLLLSKLGRAVIERVRPHVRAALRTVRGPPPTRLGLLLADLAVLRI